MKVKTMAIFTIILAVLLVAGASMAWFYHSPDGVTNIFNLGTVDVEVVEGFLEINEHEYKKEVRVHSLGSKETYVRVRLVPEWSDSNLPVSNVEFNLSNGGNWTAQQVDGYYYYKKVLNKDETTDQLLSRVTFTSLDGYEEAIFKLHVIAEGVQASHNAWQSVWRLRDLPF